MHTELAFPPLRKPLMRPLKRAKTAPSIPKGGTTEGEASLPNPLLLTPEEEYMNRYGTFYNIDVAAAKEEEALSLKEIHQALEKALEMYNKKNS